MHRPRALAVLPAAVLLAVPAGAGAAPRAGVELVSCTPALDPVARSAAFEGRMRAIRRSARMQMRFTLQSRAPGGDWKRVAAPGWQAWLTAQPGVGRYAYVRTVQNLPVPARYRTVVRFRWLDGKGRRLARRLAVSPACRQPDLRPDLEPRRLEVLRAPGQPKLRRYIVWTGNAGLTAAGPFTVVLRLPGQPELVTPVAGLVPDAREFITFTAPACTPGEPLAAAVDAGATVDERDEEDNLLAAPCPD